MKPYRFRLENILNYRERIEDLKKAELVEFQKRLEGEIERLDSLVASRKKQIDELLAKDEFDAGELELYRSYILRTKEKLIEHQKIVENCRKLSEEKRNEVIEAAKGRKLLDAMRQKGQKEHIRNENKKEQKLFDELVANRFGKDEKKKVSFGI